MHHFMKGKTQRKTSLTVEFQAMSLASAAPSTCIGDSLAQRSSPEVNFENSNGPYFLSPG